MQRRRTAAHQLLQVAESPCGSPAGSAGGRLARSAAVKLLQPVPILTEVQACLRRVAQARVGQQRVQARALQQPLHGVLAAGEGRSATSATGADSGSAFPACFCSMQLYQGALAALVTVTVQTQHSGRSCGQHGSALIALSIRIESDTLLHYCMLLPATICVFVSDECDCPVHGPSIHGKTRDRLSLPILHVRVPCQVVQHLFQVRDVSKCSLCKRRVS